MTLIPSGHLKLMESQEIPSINDYDKKLREVIAQSQADVQPGVVQQPIGTGGTEQSSPITNNQTDNQQLNLNTPQQPQNTSSDEKVQNDMVQHILSYIVKWGWPERLAKNYQEEMVDEKIGPMGQRDFTIVVPNTYYGKGMISNEDIQEFILGLTKQFGIHFLNANRKGKKAILQFSTEKRDINIDPMQEIYGGKSKKTASTMMEILNNRREELYNTMRKIANGEK